MATIKAFKGIRYNSDRVTDLSTVITPPYDVIGPAEQEHYYHRSPYNIIRLEYGTVRPEDCTQDNRYSRAAATQQRWLSDKILLPEKETVLYLYEQVFLHNGTTYRRTGIAAALHLEPYASKVVLPHEETHSRPKSDRLELLRYCRANFSPIFGLFTDPEQETGPLYAAVKQEPPLFEISGDHGESHRLWAIRNRAQIEALTQILAPRPVFIADGHHRYETALSYAQEAGAQVPGARFVLAFLVSLQDPGLIILPTHRVVGGLTAERIGRLLQIVGDYFHAIDRGSPADLNLERFVEEMRTGGESAPVLGLLLPGKALLLTPKTGGNGALLDTVILQNYILSPLFAGMAERLEQSLSYTRSTSEARQATLECGSKAAFIMNPMPIEAVTARALRGEKMPQKSTYFHPKLPSGLVIHHLELSH
ncbi:MAG: DUF1015 domain-containing protein [Bacillota bacterium]